MVSSQGYVDGANTLLYSLQKHLDPRILPQISFVALLIDHHTGNHIFESILFSDWAVRKVKVLHPAVTFERFKEQFTKLHLWKMTEFHRILYLDTGTLVLKDPSALLTSFSLDFAAVKDWETGSIQSHFNMGVFSLKPDANEFHRLNRLRMTERDYS